MTESISIEFGKKKKEKEKNFLTQRFQTIFFQGKFVKTWLYLVKCEIRPPS